MRDRTRLLFWAVVAGAACLLGIGSCDVPLFEPDEARFARTSVEMIRDGDLVVPHFEGRPRLVKPPLMHWVQSSFFRLFGATEGAARLHSTLATLGLLLISGWVAARRWGGEAAVWCAAVLATMPLVVVAGFFGTIDALLAVHVFAVVALDVTRPPEGRRHEALLIGAVLGLSFLAKGPVGVVLPMLVLLAGRTVAGRQPLTTARALALGTAAWCAVVLPWGLAFLGRVSSGRVFDTLRAEALERYFAGTAHVEPPWFYLQVLLAGCLPWFVPLVASLVRVVRERDDPAARTARYVAAGLVTGLVFFSLGKSKLPTYILPLAPLVALMATWELGRELEARDRRSWVCVTLAAFLGLTAIVLGLTSMLRPEAFVRNVAAIGGLLYAAGCVVAFRGVGRRRPRAVWGAAAFSTAAFLTVAMTLGVPELSKTHSTAWLVRAVPELAANRPVAVVEMKRPGLTYYLDRVPEQVDGVHLRERLDRPGDLLLVFDEDDLEAVEADTMARMREIGRQGKYVVFERRAEPAP